MKMFLNDDVVVTTSLLTAQEHASRIGQTRKVYLVVSPGAHINVPRNVTLIMSPELANKPDHTGSGEYETQYNNWSFLLNQEVSGLIYPDGGVRVDLWEAPEF